MKVGYKMKKIKDFRMKRIYDMVSIIKLISLILASIVFIQGLFAEKLLLEYMLNSNSDIFEGLMAIYVLLLIYLILVFSRDIKYGKKNDKSGNLVENTFFVINFFMYKLSFNIITCFYFLI